MSTRISLRDVLSDFGPTLNSVSVRTACYRVETQWYNLISVIDFSELDAVSLSGKICGQWNSLGSVDHERLRFGHETFSYERCAELFDQLKTGVLAIGDLEVHLARKLDALSESGNIQCYLRTKWPEFQLQTSGLPCELDAKVFQSIRSANNDAEIQRYLSTVPYDSLHEAISCYLGLVNDAMRQYECDVLARVPIFAKINEARCDFEGGPVTVTYETHPKLGEQIFLSCTVSSTEDSSRQRIKMPISVRLSESLFESTTTPIADKTSRLDALLIHRRAGSICNSGWLIRISFPKKTPTLCGCFFNDSVRLSISPNFWLLLAGRETVKIGRNACLRAALAGSSGLMDSSPWCWDRRNACAIPEES